MNIATNATDSESEESTPLKTTLFHAVATRLATAKFMLRVSRQKFLRRREARVDHLQLICLDARPGYRVQPSIGVRHNRVEDIFHKTSRFDRKYQSNTSTVGTAVGLLISDDSRACEFRLGVPSDIDDVVEKVVDVFETYALPYYEQWSSLEAIDVELNDKPHEPTIHRGGGWLRCSTGIIVARLVARPNYKQLAGFYHEVMTKDNKGFYLKRFEGLLVELNQVEAGNQWRSQGGL